jgi:hypothetical protein
MTSCFYGLNQERPIQNWLTGGLNIKSLIQKSVIGQPSPADPGTAAESGQKYNYKMSSNGSWVIRETAYVTGP